MGRTPRFHQRNKSRVMILSVITKIDIALGIIVLIHSLILAIVYYFFYYKPIKHELKREEKSKVQGIDFPADEPYPYDNFR